ncbi:MAG: polysaccharide deacetylase family protein [Armatimonadetes bacterium]|nr:polysaccharide deacetylase family protein [Armatimonadota bacterium]
MKDAPIVILGMDCETDVGSFYYTYEGLVHGTPLLLKLLASRGLEATFFFTGDAARRHPNVVRSVLDAGHEVGCHSLYHETIGEPLFDVPGVTPLLPEEVDHRLEVATQWVEEAAGVRPISFRAPRLFGGTGMINALERLGYVADASYPMYFYQQRLAPYHPSAEDWTQEGDLRILEIPNFADMSLESQDPYGRDRDQWPLFRTEGAAALLKHIDNFIVYVRERGVQPVLCFYFHPWEFVPQPESMFIGEGTVVPAPFIVQNCGPYALEQFSLLLDGLLERGAAFMTCQRLAEEW